jgi:DNA-binding response OmpR family regulator
MKILVIEDEPSMRDVILRSLQKESFLVETAKNLKEAIHKITTYDYSCILLDIMLPDGNGLEILKVLNEMDKTDSVIIISAKDSLDDKVEGLTLGADDYLTKPFHMAELNARIKSVLRRKNFEGKNVIEIANVTINVDDRTIAVSGKALPLNRKELDILIYFIVNKNRLVVKTALAEHVWGQYADEANDFEFIYSQIKNLRKKLKEYGAGIEIQAVYGIGYKMVTL